MVRELKGDYWKDLDEVRVEKDGSISIKKDQSLLPTDLEAAAIKAAVLKVEFPALKPLHQLTNLPPELKTADPKNLFIFKSIDGMILMLQQRVENKKGERSYIPWTYWDDNEWRKSEPDDKLPLWGLDGLKNHTTVYIHEGAKAARAMREMVEAATPEMKKKLAEHPWGQELSNACHVGWIGGALNPSRTDWNLLNRLGFKRAYIVSDNDIPGVSAVPNIAFHLRMTTFQVQFDQQWPVSFDLADDFPKTMFEEMDGKIMYKGPSWRACLHPATWATDLIPNPRGKPTPALREHFKEMWAYVEEADMFFCIEMPEIARTEKILNNILSAFSHTYETCKLILKCYTGRSVKLCYRPDLDARMIVDKTTSAINLHTPTTIKPQEGNPKPFLDFLAYMFPNPTECKEIMRWVATLIAKRDIRMEYGLLLVSETQGIGKSTLGTSILGPLVGFQNVGIPAENDIVNSEFNDWIANKRLVVVHEIYSGHSWKAYNRLKSLITDNDISVNQKYQRRYTIDNWCHIIACSNSMRALKIETDDRRWFYPQVSEVRWPKQKFVEFRKWLAGGGLSIILRWAKDHGDYVFPGERAPMTARKLELIEESRSEAQIEAIQIAEAMAERQGPCALSMKEVVAHLRSVAQGQVFDSDYEIRKAMAERGVKPFKKRIKLFGVMQHVMINPVLMSVVEEMEDVFATDAIRNNLGSIRDFVTSEM